MRQEVPAWARKKYNLGDLAKVKLKLRELNLNTVCESARCPNIGECFSKPTATFMILGGTCTRRCGFCSVGKGVPEDIDPQEPGNIARAVGLLGLRHAVITSVTRDDLIDGGAGQFAAVVRALREKFPDLVIEVLTPDFRGSDDALRTVTDAGPGIFNHNVETVPRLYKKVRPQAVYERSLNVLKRAKEMAPGIYTKSGLMAGLGEAEDEVMNVMRDLRSAGCDLLTIGQYLRPTKENLEVAEHVRPEVFDKYAAAAREMGFVSVASAPFVRSSYNAEEVFGAVIK
ncbi:MAG: lipoyl synthase [Nitrospirota bacterium]